MSIDPSSGWINMSTAARFAAVWRSPLIVPERVRMRKMFGASLRPLPSSHNRDLSSMSTACASSFQSEVTSTPTTGPRSIELNTLAGKLFMIPPSTNN
jgi:hypothetical protein